MTNYELKIRIQKANEKIQNKTATIAKKETWIASGKKDDFEVKWLKEDIIRLNKEISEIKKTVEKYEKQLIGELERENILLRYVPESLKTLQAELLEIWNDYDFKRRDSLKLKYYEVGYKEFIRQANRSAYQFMQQSDVEIIKANERMAQELIIDLYNRIRNITGEITDWSGMYCSEGVLNGIVTGKEGRARIESILAGGHNIQKLHV